MPFSPPKYKVSLMEALVIIFKTYTIWTVDLKGKAVPLQA
jgi:hypothetical protein